MRRYKPPQPTIINASDERPNGLNLSCSSIEGIILGEVEVNRKTGKQVQKKEERRKKRAASIDLNRPFRLVSATPWYCQEAGRLKGYNQ